MKYSELELGKVYAVTFQGKLRQILWHQKWASNRENPQYTELSHKIYLPLRNYVYDLLGFGSPVTFELATDEQIQMLIIAMKKAKIEAPYPELNVPPTQAIPNSYSIF